MSVASSSSSCVETAMREACRGSGNVGAEMQSEQNDGR